MRLAMNLCASTMLKDYFNVYYILHKLCIIKINLCIFKCQIVYL